MKIGVNARLLTKPYTGIGQYTKNLFAELAASDDGNEYVLVVPEKVDVDFPKNVRIKVIKEKSFGLSGMKKTWWEQISVPDFFVKEKIDAAFFTYPCNPWSKDWYKKGVRTFVTVHDCIPWMNKNYRKGLLSALYHSQTKKAVKLADKVFTVSKSSADDIVEVCGVDRGKIVVAYNDASDVYKKPVDERVLREILRRYGLARGKFVLYVGGYDKRKNVPLLVEAYKKFFEKHSDIPLVLAGEKLFKGKLYDDVEENFVVKTGFLSEENLAALYSSCAVFINLSSQEGFNIPVIEAANCGSPIILSDIPVHREIAAPSGGQAENVVSFVDFSVEEVVSALEKVMEVKRRFGRCFASQNGLDTTHFASLRAYSWKNCAMIVKKILNA